MSLLRHVYAGALLPLVLLAACTSPPGQPKSGSQPVPPNEIVDFKTLYADNCAGCHGREGRGGPAIALADPVYLAIANKDALRKVVANGVRGTSMSAFAQSAGGMLTDKQVDVIINGMQSRWSRPGVLDGTNPPSYTAKAAGNVQAGQVAFGTYCASCHGAAGEGTHKGSAITDDSFLALVSDQGLRTIVIVGRPELKAPDWRGNVSGKPMSDQEITDVVAWLASKRVQYPGQPYTAANNAQH